MTEPRYHPDPALLAAFFAGELPMGMNLAVSAHVDQCAQCQREGQATETRTADAWFEATPAPQDQAPDPMLAGLIDEIVTQPAAPQAEYLGPSSSARTLQVHEYQVHLPRVLADLAEPGFTWKEIGKGIYQALLDIDQVTKCEFISIMPGSVVPRHTHMGQEIMLVLSGDIIDDWGTYHAADLVSYTPEHCHGQRTEEGCVCLFVTDAPLKFTEGLPRLLNPVNRLKHWWQQRSA